MDDFIDDVGIDAKHSFEDAIMPVTQAAAGVLELFDETLKYQAVAQVLGKGYSPVDYTLLCYGGGGPLHVAGYTADVPYRDVLVPAWAETGGVDRRDLARQLFSPWVLLALGMGLVLRQGRVDLSVWVVFSVASVVATLIVQAGGHSMWSAAGAAGVGGAFAALHALAIVRFKLPSWGVTLATAAVGVGLVKALTGGEILTIDPAMPAGWPDAVGELVITGAMVIATALIALLLSAWRYVRRTPPGPKTLSAALIASSLLSAMGGLCWVLKTSRTPMPGHLLGDLRVPAAAVLAGAVLFKGNGRTALVCILIPFAMVVATAWRQYIWPTPTWALDVNLLALIVLLLGAQLAWGDVTRRRAGPRANIWPILAAMGILAVGSAVLMPPGLACTLRQGGGVALWLVGVSGGLIRRLRRKTR
ncbi:hypothetical protein LCGC14_1475150 [marine sediment metagenome]|uniref:Hydantoinase A/oxoprolinase domain-containing protein n=1 Tax=marine sediment metagenome TaxID=412755 RepID=A0A0F9JBV1_9ZZZZ